MGLPFGGISGLTTRDEGREIYGISDAQKGGRIYRFALDDAGGALRIETLTVVSLAMAPGDESPDHEGIALLPDGTFAVSAEGTSASRGSRRRSHIYGRHGDFVRRLPIPEKFVPEPNGSATKGARGNAGFESLTLSPDGARLFTAAETALLQDGDPATFDAGARTRILEFVSRRGHVRAGTGVRLRPRTRDEGAVHAWRLHQRARRSARAGSVDAAGARARVRREPGRHQEGAVAASGCTESA